MERISGHKNLSMVERYSHQNVTHLQAAMDYDLWYFDMNISRLGPEPNSFGPRVLTMRPVQTVSDVSNMYLLYCGSSTWARTRDLQINRKQFLQTILVLCGL